jgi:hypothetical protein
MGSQLSSPIQTKWVASYSLPSFSIVAVEMQGRHPEMNDFYSVELFPRKNNSHVDLFLGNSTTGVKARITEQKDFLEVDIDCKDKRNCCFVYYENGSVKPALSKTKLSGKDILLLSSAHLVKDYSHGFFSDLKSNLNEFTTQLLETMLKNGSLTNFAVTAIQMVDNAIPSIKKECYVGFCNSNDTVLKKRYETDVRNHVSVPKMIEKIILESKQKRKQELIIKLSETPILIQEPTAAQLPLKKKRKTVNFLSEPRKSKRVRFNVDRYGLFA